MEPLCSPITQGQSSDNIISPHGDPLIEFDDFSTSIPSTINIEDITGSKISSSPVEDNKKIFTPPPMPNRLKKRSSSSFSLSSRASAIPTRGGKRYGDATGAVSQYSKREKLGISMPSKLDMECGNTDTDCERVTQLVKEIIKGKKPATTSFTLNRPEEIPISNQSLEINSPLLSASTSTTTPPDILDTNLIALPIFIRSALKNRYRPGVSGPFVVFVERMVASNNSHSVAPSVLCLAKALHTVSALSSFMEVAFDFRKAGTNRYSISFLSGGAANLFAEKVTDNNGKIRRGEKWVAYVPDFRVKKKVVLFGIDDPDLEAPFIRDNLRPTHNWCGSWSPPKDVELLKKRVPDKDSDTGYKLIDSKTFIGIFDNFELPSFVFFLGKKIYLRPFVNKVIQCRHCLRFGHLDKSCRRLQDAPVCFKCASSGHSGETCQSSTIYCANCERGKLSDSNHQATSLKCPVFIHNKHLKRIMAVHCMGHIEAENFIRVSGINTSSDPDSGGGPPPLTLEDFWPQLLKIPSAVSYVGAVRGPSNSKDTAQSDNSLRNNNNVGVKYPTKNSKFLSNLHILRKKKTERIRREANRDTARISNEAPEASSSANLMLNIENDNLRSGNISSPKKSSQVPSFMKSVSIERAVLKGPSLDGKECSLSNLQYINKSFFDSLYKSNNPMSKLLIKFFLNQFSSPSSSRDGDETLSHPSLNIAHLKNLKNLFSEGLTLFNNFPI